MFLLAGPTTVLSAVCFGEDVEVSEPFKTTIPHDQVTTLA